MKNKILIIIAHFIRIIKLPHPIKYLFYLVLKGRTLIVDSVSFKKPMFKDLNIGYFIDYWIFMDGLYEKQCLNYLKKRLKSGGAFLDVGAHIGNHTIGLSDKFRHVYAFEPEKQNYRKLVRNIRINSKKNIKAVKCAVSDSEGTKWLNIIENENCGHSLLVNYRGKTEKVKVVTLDSFVKSIKISRINFMKIDVEGAELKVLQGAVKIIKKFHPTIMIELNRPVLQSTGNSLEELYSLLTSFGYNCYKFYRKNLVRIYQKDLKEIYYENALFLHSSS